MSQIVLKQYFNLKSFEFSILIKPFLQYTQADQFSDSSLQGTDIDEPDEEIDADEENIAAQLKELRNRKVNE